MMHIIKPPINNADSMKFQIKTMLDTSVREIFLKPEERLLIDI